MAVVWITLAVGYGVFFSFSVFFVPLVAEFRWSRALTAGALSVSTVVQGISAPLAGMVVDRFGVRPVILTGSALLAIATMAAASIQAPWQLYLWTGVIGAIGLVGVGWVPMGVLLSHWFSERRGRAVGVAFSGMGVGILVVGPLAQWLIAALGWRVATFGLGAGALAVLLPVVWWGGRDPAVAPRESARAEKGAATDGATLADAVRTRAFWALFLAYFFTPLAVFPVALHQVAFAIDLGFSPMFAASVFGTMGLMSTFGRAGFGVAADRLGGAPAATLSFACTAGGALSLLALEASPHPAWLVVYAVLFGLGFGARGPIITAMASDLFGGRRFGIIYGVLNLGNGLGAAIGPWFAGAVHDRLGSYRVAFLAAVLFSVMASVCFWAVRRRSP